MLSIKHNPANFDELTTREWLVTNGLGGFASSSVLGANTRRYHGLLVAALNAPTDRRVLVSKVEECIVLNRDCVFPLSSNRYPGTIHPHGFQYFRFFERRPLPRVKFEAQDFHLLKTVFMVHGSNTTVIEYENTGDTTFRLRLTPLLVGRDYHALFHEDPSYDFYTRQQAGYFTYYAHFGAPPLHFSFSTGEYTEQRVWYRNFEYDRERERGLDYHEDAFAPAHVTAVLAPGETLHLVFSLDEAMMRADPAELKTRELQRLEALAPREKALPPFVRDLMVAADQFVVRRVSTDSYTLIAGYPWFTDWGRDTMIALRGLTIATGRQEVSKSILQTFLRYVDRGMLPNRFPDNPGEDLEYNTIDATLWLFVALYEYVQKFDDQDFIAEVFDKLTDILDCHLAGTRFNIHVTDEGFLCGGEGSAQLTWMDARVASPDPAQGEFVVTPRHGCPVEIQALWFNALRIYQYFAGTIGAPYEPYKAIADRLQQHFAQRFRRPGGGLYDVVVPGASVDDSVRPNQLYAVSLPFALLGRDDEKSVVAVVEKQLLTPFGLRTLSADHPDFKPVYAGDPWHRDTAYHQGTVWPFLLGEYVQAYLKVHDWSEAARKHALGLFEPLRQHFYQHECLSGISEVFDGALPGAGKGAVQQAWSVAAVLKALLDLHTRQKRKPSVIPFLERASVFL